MPDGDRKFDRTAEDTGNIVSMEHVNTEVPDQSLATLFYVAGLGLTRDPYQMVSLNNMWINAGRCQFHLPTGAPQVLHGHTALVMPGRKGLLRRLGNVKKQLDGTKFAYTEKNDHVEAVSPWGNVMRCYEPGPRFGKMMLGMPYVEIEVARAAADGIARFYKEIFKAPASVADEPNGRAAHIKIGADQELVFRETDGPVPDWAGYHVAVYLADFSGPYRKLVEKNLISRETNQHEYRFIDITDLGTGKVLARLEHEVRSMTHPGYARPLVNRNPDAMNPNYAPGHEALSYAVPPPASA